MNSREVFTIGHSTHSQARFVRLLLDAGVTALADVRSVPYSRFQPQFNRSTLPQILGQSGIAYVFLGDELGARSNDPSCYEDDRVQYERLAATSSFKCGIDRVLLGMKSHSIALMCAEKEPLECHRTLLVGRELDALGVAVIHIHADGRHESHADANVRLLDIAGLPHVDLFRSYAELLAEAYTFQERRTAYVRKNGRMMFPAREAAR